MNGKPFSQKEDDYIRDNHLEKTLKQMGEHLSRSPFSVYTRMKKVLKITVPEEVLNEHRARPLIEWKKDNAECGPNENIRTYRNKELVRLEMHKFSVRPKTGFNYALGYVLHQDALSVAYVEDITIIM